MANPQSVLNPATLSAELQSPLFNQPMLGQAAQDLYAQEGETLEATGQRRRRASLPLRLPSPGRTRAWQRPRVASPRPSRTSPSTRRSVPSRRVSPAPGSPIGHQPEPSARQQAAGGADDAADPDPDGDGARWLLQQQSAATAEATAAGTAASVQTNAAGEMGALGTVAYDNATAANMNNNAAAMKNSEVNFELAAARG